MEIPKILLDWHNELFWILFIIIGLLILARPFFGTDLLDILLGLILIVIGFDKLSEELLHEKHTTEKDKLSTNIKQINEWIDHSHNFVQNMKTRHESRLHRLDRKKTMLDNKIEEKYRELAKKILELENNLNRMTKLFKYQKP